MFVGKSVNVYERHYYRPHLQLISVVPWYVIYVFIQNCYVYWEQTLRIACCVIPCSWKQTTQVWHWFNAQRSSMHKHWPFQCMISLANNYLDFKGSFHVTSWVVVCCEHYSRAFITKSDRGNEWLTACRSAKLLLALFFICNMGFKEDTRECIHIYYDAWTDMFCYKPGKNGQEYWSSVSAPKFIYICLVTV